MAQTNTTNDAAKSDAAKSHRKKHRKHHHKHHHRHRHHHHRKHKPSDKTECENAPNEKLQSLVTALYIRKNVNQISDIQNGIKEAISNNDIIALKYWHQTQTNCNVEISPLYKQYIEIILQLHSAMENIDLESNTTEIDDLQQIINDAYTVKLTGYTIMGLESAEQCIECYKIFHKSFDSEQERMEHLQRFVDKIDPIYCDAKSVIEMQTEINKYNIIQTQKSKLQNAMKLNIFEDLLDTINETEQLNLGDLKELKDAKDWYKVEEQRVFELKKKCIENRINYDVIIDKENSTKLELFQCGKDNRKDFKPEPMIENVESESVDIETMSGESVLSELELSEIEAELQRKDMFDMDSKVSISENKEYANNEPFIPGWTDDLHLKIKHHKNGPKLSEYTFLRTWKDFRRFNIYLSKQNWLRHSSSSLIRTLSIISTDRCGSKEKSKELKTIALQMFNTNLRMVMGDSTMSHGMNRVALAKEYINTMNSDELLRDEAYCQIIKQTTNNSNHHSEIIGWRMFYALALHFLPSPSLLRIAKTHICKHAKEFGICAYQSVSELAALTLKFIDTDLRTKSRSVIFENDMTADTPQTCHDKYFKKWSYPYNEILFPQSLCVQTELDKMFTTQQFKINILVYSMDKEQEPISIDLDTLSNDDQQMISKRVCKLMGIIEYARYGLRIEIHKSDQIKIFSDLQYYANNWIQQLTPMQLIEHTLKYDIIKKVNDYKHCQYKYVFYKWCFSPFDKQLELESDVYVDLLYLQAYDSVMNGINHKLSNDKFAMLTTLELLKSQRGNAITAQDFQISELMENIPKYARHNLKDNQWLQLCSVSMKKLIKYGLHKFKTSMHFEREYLKIVQTDDMYGMTYFPIKVLLPTKWKRYDKLLFGCNWHYIVIAEEGSLKIYKEMKMRNVKSIKQSSKTRSHIEFEYKDSDNGEIITYQLISINLQGKLIAKQVYDLRRMKKK